MNLKSEYRGYEFYFIEDRTSYYNAIIHSKHHKRLRQVPIDFPNTMPIEDAALKIKDFIDHEIRNGGMPDIYSEGMYTKEDVIREIYKAVEFAEKHMVQKKGLELNADITQTLQTVSHYAWKMEQGRIV